MKNIIFIGLCVILLSSSAQAETMYVSDNIEITLRTGPGIDHKIISMIKPGLELEVIQSEHDWSQVLLPNGIEGWVINRFITDVRPSRLELNKLKKKHKELIAQSVSLFDENKACKVKNKQLSSELLNCKETLSNVSKSYETLKSESADFLKLQSTYNKTASELAEQNKKVEKLEEDLSKLLLQHNIKWFLSGAGVLLIGLLIGFSAKRQRRRSSLL
ncbi:MAG: TIGR04211 family SH3 domain-containing protein [Deltaproteobacteria bacterium]|nr:TIGR04211 family SH3 domain-containing protein [Deltaproteobacteria bacterium]MBW2661528.1 TIGR04211 family SH3 domain-containing protein [Deltaproteobacteria bacterium]